MESKKRGVWIWVVLVAGLGLACCCALAVAGAIGVPAIVRSVSGEDTGWPVVRIDRLGPEMSERTEQTFEVDSGPTLEVSNFAGAVTIRAGGEDTIRVVATRMARRARDLEDIRVEMSGEGSRVKVKTSFAGVSGSNPRVILQITVPAETDLDLRTSAGAIEVYGVQGDLEADAAAGGITIQGASGSARLTAGAGGIDYEGQPSGACTFHVGAGGITLRLRADADVRVDLTAGLGGVSSELPVDGSVGVRSIHGTIGTGEKGSISATAGVGGIDLVRR